MNPDVDSGLMRDDRKFFNFHVCIYMSVLLQQWGT